MSKEFLFNPNNPKKSFDVYIDKNPKDTIPIKYSSLEDNQKTLLKEYVNSVSNSPALKS